MDELQRQIAELTARLTAVEENAANQSTNSSNVPILAGPQVSGTPTANGYVPFFVNGKRINLLKGS